jgi:hypothetical protein
MSQAPKPAEAEKSRPAIKTTRSPWSVILSTIVGGGMLTVCLTCGIALYQFRPTVQTDPDAARRLKEASLDMQVSEIFRPKGTIDWNIAYLLRMQGAYYEHAKADGELVLLNVDSRFFSSQELRDHVRKTLLDKGGTGVPLKRDDVTFKDIMIQNEPVRFRFEKGRSPVNEKPYYVVDGVVHGKKGEVLVGIRLEADAWNEPEMMGMLESIK